MLANGRLAAALGGHFEMQMLDEMGEDGQVLSSDKKFKVRFKKGSFVSLTGKYTTADEYLLLEVAPNAPWVETV